MTNSTDTPQSHGFWAAMGLTPQSHGFWGAMGRRRFFRRAAVEITFEDRKYLVVPQAAILTLVREDPPEDSW